MFHGFPLWGQVVANEELDTVRLDDVPETEGVTLLVMDIQGSELMALRSAEVRLRDAVVLHLEVCFMQLYKDQPLFSEIELFLRQHGFALHKFAHQVSRTIQPMVVDNSIHKGLSQLVWGDAVFIRDFSSHGSLTDDQLLAMGAILHECYASLDVVHHLLATYDRRHATQHGAGLSRVAGQTRRLISTAQSEPIDVSFREEAVLTGGDGDLGRRSSRARPTIFSRGDASRRSSSGRRGGRRI